MVRGHCLSFSVIDKLNNLGLFFFFAWGRKGGKNQATFSLTTKYDPQHFALPEKLFDQTIHPSWTPWCAWYLGSKAFPILWILKKPRPVRESSEGCSRSSHLQLWNTVRKNYSSLFLPTTRRVGKQISGIKRFPEEKTSVPPWVFICSPGIEIRVLEHRVYAEFKSHSNSLRISWS